uniref:RRM domain-containing protein n=1 Tax=Heterorhabditis bacteriophora TaxID=37862 RepID=A0A1I7XJI8_HETBA
MWVTGFGIWCRSSLVVSGLDCEDVVIGRSGGRPSGEAFVRLASRDQVTKALEFNKQHMGTSRSAYPYGSPKSRNTHSRPAPYDVPRMSGYHGYGGYGYDDFISPTKISVYNDYLCVAFRLMLILTLSNGFLLHFIVWKSVYVELFAANDMPPSMRRLTWRVIGGKPAPPPQPLSAPRSV